MIEVNNDTVIIDLKGNTFDDKANVIRELAIAFKGVSEVIGIKPKRLLKLVREYHSILKKGNTPKEGQDVKEN